MCRELKWEQYRLDIEWEKCWIIEKKEILLNEIINEFKYANKYFKLYTINREDFNYSYKNDLINNKYIDFKLIKIIFLPDELIDKIFNSLFNIL
tara:strand:+ start:474 stop:755 length:282 start_codon:yes stop_codon:yes gene_type:complete